MPNGNCYFPHKVRRPLMECHQKQEEPAPNLRFSEETRVLCTQPILRA